MVTRAGCSAAPYDDDVTAVDSTASGINVVRTFLNTWEWDADEHKGEDHLPGLMGNRSEWQRVLPGLPFPLRGTQADVVALRHGLRAALGERAPDSLQHWVLRFPPQVVIGADEKAVVTFVPGSTTTTAVLVSIVTQAVSDGHWKRLKSCDACQWVFYDRSRNFTRRWCGMYAETPHGRACGSIAKVRAYRERVKEARS